MITDELREWKGNINTRLQPETVLALRSELNCIADRIDAEHRAALEKLAAQLDETSDMREFCERLDQAATNHEDVTLWGVGYTPLPVDADGVPIRVGDMVEGEKVGGGFGESFEVVGYIMSNGELEPMDEHNCPRKRKYLRHHHEPNVEDVLRQFAREIDADAYGITDAKVAEYAAKLRLAGEDA